MRALALVSLVAVALLAGCGGDEAGDGAADAAALTGVPWTLAAGLDVPGWEAFAPSARFDGGSVGGSSGCNRYGASYELDGDALTLGPIAGTQMGCEATRAAVEEAYLAALERVAAWRVAGDELTLGDAGGEELLRFTVPRLDGSWEATAFLNGYAVKSPLPGTEVTAAFEDGRMTGSAGCNGYGAGYTAERGTIEIEPPAATEIACPRPAGVMEQEQAYLSALPLAAAYAVEGDTLTLLTAAGTIVATYLRVR